MYISLPPTMFILLHPSHTPESEGFQHVFFTVPMAEVVGSGSSSGDGRIHLPARGDNAGPKSFEADRPRLASQYCYLL